LELFGLVPFGQQIVFGVWSPLNVIGKGDVPYGQHCVPWVWLYDTMSDEE
jgi:hypothetical protein